MAYPNKVPVADKIYCGRIADISTANSACHIPIWGQGEVVHVATCIANAITSANATITVLKNGTAVTGGTITVTQSGSAEGDVDSVDITLGNCSVQKGDQIEVSSDGGSSTACVADVIVVVREL